MSPWQPTLNGSWEQGTGTLKGVCDSLFPALSFLDQNNLEWGQGERLIKSRRSLPLMYGQLMTYPSVSVALALEGGYS